MTIDVNQFPSGCWGEDPNDRFFSCPWHDTSDTAKGRYIGYGIWDRKAERWWMVSAWPAGGDLYDRAQNLATARTMDAVCRDLNHMNETQELPVLVKGGRK